MKGGKRTFRRGDSALKNKGAESQRWGSHLRKTGKDEKGFNTTQTEVGGEGNTCVENPDLMKR